jgi:hypothetical protein
MHGRGFVQDMKVVAYPFYGYWEDIGTVKSFFEENLKLTRHVSGMGRYLSASCVFSWWTMFSVIVCGVYSRGLEWPTKLEQPARSPIRPGH